jgi:DNA-binding SARP family transcriptional activator
MRFRVLGPVQIRTDGGWTTIKATQQRQVLAILLARAGRVVPAERLVAEIWGARRPRTAIATIRVYVMHLRRTLGDVLVTRGGGYQLAVADGDVDAHVFEGLLRDAQACADRLEAAALLARALALWQGPAMADVLSAETPVIAVEASRLEQRRLSAADRYFDLQLELGRPAEVIDDLHDLVAHHPLHERLREQLMLALHRSGRRAEALECYRAGRQLLVAELGIEPGPGLRELHLAILDGADLSRAAARPARPVGRRAAR